MQCPRVFGVADPDLMDALREAECLGRNLTPDERATKAEFEMIVDGRVVGHAWRPDASTALYLWKARGLGARQ